MGHEAAIYLTVTSLLVLCSLMAVGAKWDDIKSYRKRRSEHH
jgi:hypothetical protein